MQKETVVVMMGVSGSGKSTIRDKIVQGYADIQIVSPDDRVPVDPKTNERIYNQENLAYAWAQSWQELTRALIQNKGLIVFDATFTTRISRSAPINVAIGAGYTVVGIYMDVPPEVCKSRNSGRFHVVPDSAMSYQMEILRPPLMTEGFDVIYTIDQTGTVSKCEGSRHYLDRILIHLESTTTGGKQ